MSTFSLLLMLLFLIIFGIRIFMYCVDIEMPMLSALMTLFLLLMILAEIVIATFELPAALIDVIVFISMGNKAIAIGCGIVIFIVLTFIFIMIYPKFNWHRILSFSLVKYLVLGCILITLTIYTELFNGSYSFHSLEEYNEFKQSFSQYDRHFWPTKFIRNTKDNGRDMVTTYSIYPWDVEIPDGRQFAYKVITFYSDGETGNEHIFNYYPFTYKLYAGVDSLPIDHKTPVSDSDLKKVSASDG